MVAPGKLVGTPEKDDRTVTGYLKMITTVYTVWRNTQSTVFTKFKVARNHGRCRLPGAASVPRISEIFRQFPFPNNATIARLGNSLLACRQRKQYGCQ